MTTIIRTLHSSEGCTVKTNTSNHACAPKRACPRIWVKISSASTPT